MKSELPSLPSPATILVVDDDVRVLKLVGLMLRMAGVDVLEAPDPQKAIQIFGAEKAKIDLMVSDIKMPGMTGPVLAQRLRAIKPDLPVLLMTGYADSIDLACDVLPKPFTMADLYQRVGSLLHTNVAMEV